MRNTRFFDIITRLDECDLTGFMDYLNSPFFNKNNILTAFYSYLLSNIEKLKSSELSKEDIFMHVFNTDKIDNGKYWKITSALGILLDEYLIQQEFKKEVHERSSLLLEAYRRRNLYNEFKKYCKTLEKDLNTEFNKGISFYYNFSHIYYQKLSYLMNTDIEKVESDISNLFENVKLCFIITTISSLNIIFNLEHGLIEKELKKVWGLKEILAFIKVNKHKFMKENKTVYVMFLILMAKIENNKIIHYNHLKRFLFDNMDKLSPNIMRHILVNMLSYCFEKLDKGNGKFIKEVFHVNRIIDEKKLVLFGEYINHDYFYSVIENAVIIKEIDWAVCFANKYYEYLAPECKESAYNLSFAKVNFAKGDYDTSLKNLLYVNNLDTYYYLSHKCLLLQNYYTMGQYSNIASIIETTKKYFKRMPPDKIHMKESYEKFINYFYLILCIKLGRKAYTDIIRKKIEKERFFVNKEWIINELNVLSS